MYTKEQMRQWHTFQTRRNEDWVRSSIYATRTRPKQVGNPQTFHLWSVFCCGDSFWSQLKLLFVWKYLKYLKIRKLFICEVVLFILVRVDFYFDLPHRTLTVVVAGIICLCIVTNKPLYLDIFILTPRIDQSLSYSVSLRVPPNTLSTSHHLLCHTQDA